ncbi:MAG: type I-C CRISPR-associated protein Cas7/Csd2 [Phycisphaerae bacterium]|nr:type I-C CRISPR-associated protein Cas7/Csd2 [Phycisphaerae bacterium]
MPTKSAAPTAIRHRYDIVFFFDVTDGNPNGDPDAGNLPRIDPETSHGLVTDVCLKRKVRNYVALKHAGVPPFEIYVREKAVLNDQHERAYTALKIKTDDPKATKDEDKARALTAWMCQNFFDIRAFGAVMSTGTNAGQVRGPVQATIARSVHPIFTQEHSVTRCAVTTEKESEAQQGGNRTMGRKFSLPYALYRTCLFINPLLADPERHGTGFSDEDLDLLKEALLNMFDHDRSAARGLMSPVAICAFKHENPLGNARADQLLSRVTCTPIAGVAASSADLAADKRPPRAKSDFIINDGGTANLPKGITLERWL